MGIFCVGISHNNLAQLKRAARLSNLNDMDKFWGTEELQEVAKVRAYTNVIKVVFNELIRGHTCKNGTNIIDSFIL